MVNTRRTESGGSVPFSSHRYHTRRTNDRPIRHIDSSSGSDSDTEELQGEDDSWSSQGKGKLPALKKPEAGLSPRVRELRSRFICDERKFKTYHLRKTEATASRKLPKLKKRIEVYVSRKHRVNDMDSYNANDTDDEDGYSPRHSSRRRHKAMMGRVERRTALSLRPLTAKSYVDRSPMTCHSDDSDVAAGVRRSTRQRNFQYKNLGSWITDDQMPKKGYPNAEEYSEDDSRDAPVKRLPGRREIKKNPRYMNDYQTEDLPLGRRRSRNEDDVRNKSYHRRSSIFEPHDSSKPKKSAAARQSKSKPLQEEGDEEEDEANGIHENPIENENLNASTKEEGEGDAIEGGDANKSHAEVEENNGSQDGGTVDSEEKKGKGGAVKKESSQKSSSGNEKSNASKEGGGKEQSSESDIVPSRVTRNKGNRLLDGYSLRKNRQIRRKDSESSSSSEEGRVYALRERPKQSAPIIVRQLSPKTSRNDKLRSHRRYRRKPPSSTDTSDSEDVCRNKYSINPKTPHSKNEQQQPLKSGAGGSKMIPIGPETLDSSIRFSSVGGLDSHIQCLKEMVLLPMMYPEVFRRFQIEPPRGVLFHGPPGTGKTLIARALANECCFGRRKVSFFVRKGADLLSKWIGESEKQLRLLFEQAAEMKPSIIFFDEIDGLAPIRSSRQDQIHASIVSTLLALMDGLNNRGEVIVIGATNRIDAIDPALRRPGRFDRELFFPLPAKTEREEIIRVHISKWTSKPSDQMIGYLAENSVGYCGSDLRALCSEAVIQSFRRTYPQVYDAEHKLLLDPEQVRVEKVDFLRAKSYLIPSSHRSGQSTGRKLLPALRPLLEHVYDEVRTLLGRAFPHGTDPNLAKVKLSAGFRPAQFIIVGNSSDHGQTLHLAPALLHSMEHINIQILDITMLYRESARSAEEACIQVFQEVKRNLPSILYIPCMDQWWELVTETVKIIFNAQVDSLEPNSPILIFATANTIYEELPEQIQDIFSPYRKEVYRMSAPSDDVRREFFRPLLVGACVKCPRSPRKRSSAPPDLPKAPTPPPTPITREQERRLYEVEEHTLRELRIFLRDMCKKLANNRMFYMFTQPVDTEEVPDYPNIIKQPMDLETMMTKVDFHRYECAKDFLKDIDLIVQNALEYNPAKTSADKQIRHRACTLRDYANTLIKNEMDSDFEDKCQDIAKKRKERNAIITQYLPPFLQTQPEEIALVNGVNSTPPKDGPSSSAHLPNGTSPTRATGLSRKRKLSSWQRGLLGTNKRKRKEPSGGSSTAANAAAAAVGAGENNNQHPALPLTAEDKSSDDSKENVGESGNTTTTVATVSHSEDSQETAANDNGLRPLTVNCNVPNERPATGNALQSPNTKRSLSDLMSPSELLEDTLDFDDVDRALNETNVNDLPKQIVEISENKLNEVLSFAVEVTKGEYLQSLLDLYYQLSRIVKKYSRTYRRENLPDELMTELKRFKETITAIPSSIYDALNQTTNTQSE